MRKLSFFFLSLLACPWDGDVGRTRGHETRLRPSNAGRKHGSQTWSEKKKRRNIRNPGIIDCCRSKKKMGIQVYIIQGQITSSFLPHSLLLQVPSSNQEYLLLHSIFFFQYRKSTTTTTTTTKLNYEVLHLLHPPRRDDWRSS